MKKLEINLNLKEIKQPEIRKILEKIEMCVFIEYNLTDSEFILRDSYVVHKNKKYNTIPLRIPLKE